jgi:hypothetical protein
MTFFYCHKRQMEATGLALVDTVNEDTPVKFRCCGVPKELQIFNLGKACDPDGILNEHLRQLPKRRRIHLTHLFNHCLRLCHFAAP